MISEEEFYKKITEWLIPKGYVEVFKNHPCAKDREFHFIKNKVRVICINSSEEYCYLHSDILKQPYSLGLKTGRFEIGFKELETLHEYVVSNSKLLEK